MLQHIIFFFFVPAFRILENIQKLVLKNEELKQKEVAFKDQCRQEMARIQREIKDAERVTPEEDIRESLHLLEIEREKLQTVRLQLAKKNRAIVSIQRQLDNIPSRTELSQYQRRFLELYNQGTYFRCSPTVNRF